MDIAVSTRTIYSSTPKWAKASPNMTKYHGKSVPKCYFWSARVFYEVPIVAPYFMDSTLVILVLYPSQIKSSLFFVWDVPN